MPIIYVKLLYFLHNVTVNNDSDYIYTIDKVTHPSSNLGQRRLKLGAGNNGCTRACNSLYLNPVNADSPSSALMPPMRQKSPSLYSASTARYSPAGPVDVSVMTEIV